MSLRETKATGNEALNAREGERVCVCGVWLPRGPGARNRGDGQISALHSLDKPRAPMALPYMPPLWHLPLLVYRYVRPNCDISHGAAW